MRNLLLLNLWCFLAVGCTSAKLQPYQVWSSLETPSIFKMNELWVFVILDKEGSIKQRLTVKFTDATAETCASNEWRKLEIVDGEFIKITDEVQVHQVRPCPVVIAVDHLGVVVIALAA